MQNAFDVLAPSYDSDFTDTPIARYLRQRTHQRLLHRFTSGQQLLEIGCGTGEDALFLARHGLQVMATDASPVMLRLTAEKTAHTGHVQTALLNLNDSLDIGLGRFDGVYSNFGAVNCIHDRPRFIRWLAERVKPNGMVALGIMSPICLWEMAWHGIHGEWAIATRRFKPSSFTPDDSAEPVTVYCPSIRTLTREFAPYFERIHVEPLGLLLPPTSGYAVVEKRPRLLRFLLQWDRYTRHWRPLSLFADHYWIEFRRRI